MPMLPPVLGKANAPQIHRRVSDLSSDGGPKSSIFSGSHEKATTSIYRAQHQANDAVTSISRIGQDRQQATTSIARKEHQEARGSIYGDTQTDEQRDESRYNYIRRLIAARKSKEAEAAKHHVETATKKSELDVGKGGSFKTSAFTKQMRKYYGAHRSSYSNLSTEEKKIFSEVVTSRAKSKTTGSDFNRRDKVTMKSKIKQARLAGRMSKEDERDMRGMIDKMT